MNIYLVHFAGNEFPDEAIKAENLRDLSAKLFKGGKLAYAKDLDNAPAGVTVNSYDVYIAFVEKGEIEVAYARVHEVCP